MGRVFGALKFRPDPSFKSGINRPVPVPTLTLPLDGGSYSTSFPTAKSMNTFSFSPHLAHRSHLPRLMDSSDSFCPSVRSTNKTIQDIQRGLCAESEVAMVGPGVISETLFDVFEFKPDPLFAGVTEDTVQAHPTGGRGGERVKPRLRWSRQGVCLLAGPQGFFNEGKCWINRAVSRRGSFSGSSRKKD
jgi:hypothetical protein